MLVTYDAARDVLEVRWSTESDTEPSEWRRARSNIDLLVSEANETLGVAISAAKWLCPELAHVHHDLRQILPLSSWPQYRTPAPSILRGLGRPNAQPQLPWDLDIPRADPTILTRRNRGICQHCGAIAPNRRSPVKSCRWPLSNVCSECGDLNAAHFEAMLRAPQPPFTPAQTVPDPRGPIPISTPQPHTGPRGRTDGRTPWSQLSSPSVAAIERPEPSPESPPSSTAWKLPSRSSIPTKREPRNQLNDITTWSSPELIPSNTRS